MISALSAEPFVDCSPLQPGTSATVVVDDPYTRTSTGTQLESVRFRLQESINGKAVQSAGCLSQSAQVDRTSLINPLRDLKSVIQTNPVRNRKPQAATMKPAVNELGQY